MPAQTSKSSNPDVCRQFAGQPEKAEKPGKTGLAALFPAIDKGFILLLESWSVL
jgi:hypothetical protein